jgi:pimeloyl-ACP methyl ester carboxylesterase
MQIAVDDVALDVVEEGRGIPLVLLHGFPLAKETWDPVVRLLHGRARIVRFDLRGLGRSSGPAGPVTLERLAADLAGVLDRLSIERAVVAGHSLGAMVAWAFARNHRERLAGLALICGRSDGADEAEAANREALAAAVEADGTEPLVEAFLPRYFAPAFAEGHAELVEQTRATIERSDPLGAAAILRAMARRRSPEDLFAELRIPAAFVAGRDDALLPADDVAAAAEAVAGATFTLLDCGHFPLYETPASIAAVLGALLSRTSL